MNVAVLGDVMLDVVVVPEGPVSATSDTPSRVRVGRGGSGANLAIAIARVGHRVTYLGAVGRDGAGALWREHLAGTGVASQLDEVDAPTGVVVALVGADGQRSMYTDRGANSWLSRSFVESALVDYSHLHVSGYSLLDPATREVAVAALAAARSRGASTSVDVCSVGPLRAVGPALFASLVAGVDFLFANEEEASVLGGAGIEHALASLGGLAREVLVTRGARGAVVVCDGATASAPSLARDVIDTTGAGDAATGTYLGARLAGEGVEIALVNAMTAAAVVVGGLGAAS
ncbi:MAG TPA: PfkB family carbohydrate kinase [Acidimicrobiales bacterium]|nr:PfkB family carbohydrate kinase [Acidimicrobiales bacterium]